MGESNIFFATNTYNYGDEYTGEAVNRFNERKGNMTFFRQVMDYDALKKLKNHPKMGGSTNSDYYIYHIDQVHILDPNFSLVMVGSRESDPEIEADNQLKDKEYGYLENNNYHPLLEEIIIDDKELSYSDEMLGKWLQSGQGLEEKTENPFGLFIKQKISQDHSSGTVKPEEAGLEDVEDTDPYYYLYGELAGQEKKSIGDLDKAKIYEEKYGSIFRAFSEVPQEEIIQAPVNQKSFVNAGPGTGKTYTLMKKITYMVDTLGADPEEILVLCFTNAAVNEIKARIKKFGEEEDDRSFINIDVRTFHSFSWLLISQANEAFHDRSEYQYVDISKLNYDQSIRIATRIIKRYGEEVFGNVQHLIVDEIQDLTNERALLVMAMVRECIKHNVGITVLGDSCQAIYDYSDDETLFDLKSDRFYKYMFSEFFDCGKFYKLEHNHRQNNRLIDITSPLRKTILDGKKTPVRDSVIKMVNSVSDLVSGALSVKASRSQLDMLMSEGTVCLMCRNNAQVLATSSNLRKRGISHIVNAYNETEYYAGWIGKVFGQFSKNIIDFDEFVKLSYPVLTEIDPEEIWKRLQAFIGSANNVLRVSDILSVIAKSQVDDPAFRNIRRGNLIVSNIHKAKGREYDTVILEEKFVNSLINEYSSVRNVYQYTESAKTFQYMEEAKTLYVAVTRPRKNLFINSLASANVSLKRIITGRKRWVRGDGTRLKLVEVRALSDADILSFADLDIQSYIMKNVYEGDEINLVMDMTADAITYDIVHLSNKGRERIIGKTTVEFVEDIEAIITPHGSPYPKRITDLYVSGIHSYIASDYQSVWCWVDFCGLGDALSDVY